MQESEQQPFEGEMGQGQEFEEEMPNFQPNFGGGFGLLNLMPLVPVVLSIIVVFFLSIFLQLLYYVVTQPNEAITYWAVTQSLVISIVAAFVFGFLVKVKSGRKPVHQMQF